MVVRASSGLVLHYGFFDFSDRLRWTLTLDLDVMWRCLLIFDAALANDRW